MDTIKDGLDELEEELEHLKDTQPDDDYGDEEETIDELLEANIELKEKVFLIAGVVTKAISKAKDLKRNVQSHREFKPSDPELSKKMTYLNKLQKQTTVETRTIQTLEHRLAAMNARE